VYSVGFPIILVYDLICCPTYDQNNDYLITPNRLREFLNASLRDSKNCAIVNIRMNRGLKRKEHASENCASIGQASLVNG
jgi:hypothetical protein